MANPCSPTSERSCPCRTFPPLQGLKIRPKRGNLQPQCRLPHSRPLPLMGQPALDKLFHEIDLWSSQPPLDHTLAGRQEALHPLDLACRIGSASVAQPAPSSSIVTGIASRRHLHGGHRPHDPLAIVSLGARRSEATAHRPGVATAQGEAVRGASGEPGSGAARAARRRGARRVPGRHTSVAASPASAPGAASAPDRCNCAAPPPIALRRAAAPRPPPAAARSPRGSRQRRRWRRSPPRRGMARGGQRLERVPGPDHLLGWPPCPSRPPRITPETAHRQRIGILLRPASKPA